MYSIISFNQRYRYSDHVDFICDTEADISSLPTSNVSIGSRALVVENAHIYILGNDRAWTDIGEIDELWP